MRSFKHITFVILSFYMSVFTLEAHGLEDGSEDTDAARTKPNISAIQSELKRINQDFRKLEDANSKKKTDKMVDSSNEELQQLLVASIPALKAATDYLKTHDDDTLYSALISVAVYAEDLEDSGLIAEIIYPLYQDPKKRKIIRDQLNSIDKVRTKKLRESLTAFDNMSKGKH